MSIKIANPSERQITTGHGEYIVYHKTPAGKTAPSRSIYDAVYTLCNQLNLPTTDNRYEVIRSKIQKIDPSLEITFVPRTYYEMRLLKQAIKEDLARNDFCSNEHTPPNPYAPTNTKSCWHISYFKNQFDLDEDNNAEAVKVLAFNMNNNLVKKLSKIPETTLTFGTISKLSDKQIQFFRNFHDTFNFQKKCQNGGFKTSISAEQSLLAKFSDDKHKFAMGLKDKQDVEIIQNAVALECHSIAEKAFLFYRGTDFPTDLPYSPNNPNEPYSFSFGPSLFAGAMNCGAAAGYVYAKSSRDGYVMAVPVNDPSSLDLFDIPKKHTICQLTTARDLVFHPRTKVWKTNGPVWGFDSACHNKSITGPYACDLDRETLTDRVLSLKQKNVIFLKSSNNPVMTLPPSFQPTIHIFCSVPEGQSLTIKGDNAGLNWGQGQPLIQIDDAHWIHRISDHFNHLNFKVLLNDVYEEGNNHELIPNNSVIEAPYFKVTSFAQPVSGKKTRLSVRCQANTLEIRGEGPGLGWAKGAPLKHLGANLWVWETSQHFDSFMYKLFLNGSTWEKDPNHRAHYGKKEEVFPRF